MKLLKRSQTNRMLAGVCAGIADYFNVDPTLVRIVTVLLGFITSGFPILIAYIVLAFIMPNEGDITE
ncbi:PspC domain-containing protein [Alteribacillus iranensis]|uniref:Phage shock protein PspC (Stress-responsive transcriptional regulator) n=1 Tax=Alteribacillus iranensis TaxID=930128 RepID=A0A1I2EKH9_9BACI|nr:PspC domain-containing protein [Alteribacillus iranensis]SFE93375.1 Phage shock protein PspC (stress-responsive transcriptional regulator) [Alteribacillus iranensis]